MEMQAAAALVLLLAAAEVARGTTSGETTPTETVTMDTMMPKNATELPLSPPGPGDAINVDKCCALGEHLNAEFNHCVMRPGYPFLSTMSYEELLPPLSERDVYWLPAALRVGRVHASYSRLDDDRRETRVFMMTTAVEATPDAVRRYRQVDNAARRFEVGDFNMPAAHVSWQTVCFDASADPRRPHAIISTISLPYVHKCCRKDERVSPSGGCEEDPEVGAGEGAVEHEALLPEDGEAALNWLPPAFRGGAVLARYGASRDQWRRWNVIVDTDDTRRWRVVKGSGAEMTVWVNGYDGVQGVTREVCFDRTPGAPLPSRVLVAAVARAPKCCGRGERFDSRLARCELLPGAALDSAEALTGLLDPHRDANASYWLPSALGQRPLPVRYMPEYRWRHTNMYRAEQRALWLVRYDMDREPTLVLFLSTAAGRTRTLTRRDFCFEATAGGPLAPRALVAFETGEAGVVDLPKCCVPGERLSPRRTCERHNGSDWTPASSAAASLLVRDAVYRTSHFTNPLCADGAFGLQPFSSPHELLERLRFNLLETRLARTTYCADYLRGSDGSVREALAYCALPPSAQLFEAVRPLHVVAALLLVGAVAAILRREKTRRSAHGRLLLCHAGCLLVANVLQATWFFVQERDKDCEAYAYSIYFFLIGSAFWLNVISYNMMRGFRRPPGARASSSGGDWRRFALQSLYAWGATVAMTGLCIGMHRWGQAAKEKGFVVPNLLETKTCYMDLVRSSLVYSPQIIVGDVMSDDDLGSLLYYYVPTTLLVLINAVCLALTLLHIRYLKKDTGILQNTPSTLRSALLYVKLLLTAGVLEAILELAAWGARRRRYDRFWFWSKEHAHSASLDFAVAGTFLDLLRAAAVLWLSAGRCGCASVARRWLQEKMRGTEQDERSLAGATPAKHGDPKRLTGATDSTAV